MRESRRRPGPEGSRCRREAKTLRQRIEKGKREPRLRPIRPRSFRKSVHDPPEGSGQPGASTIEHEYEFVLGARFLEVRNTSTYAPQEKNPGAEIHEDRGFVRWDRGRKRFVFRQFHVEGFVNQYVADSVAVSPDSIVFRSESIENIPAGYRARETYRILGPDEFAERFELAEPGGDFAVSSESRFTRKR